MREGADAMTKGLAGPAQHFSIFLGNDFSGHPFQCAQTVSQTGAPVLSPGLRKTVRELMMSSPNPIRVPALILLLASLMGALGVNESWIAPVS